MKHRLKGAKKTYTKQIKSSKETVKKRFFRHHHFAIQGAILFLVVALFVINRSQQTNPSIRYNAGFSGALQSSTIDEVASAGVAANIARGANLVISDNVTNLADSLDAQLSFATTYDAYLDKPQIVTTNTKTRDDVITYTTKQGDTVSDLANTFNVTSDTIRWANNLRGNILPAGKELTIPPVNGVLHTVKESDTPESLAKRYDASEAQIIAFNDAEIDGLPVGEQVVIPDGVQPAVRRTYNTGSRVAFSFGTQAIYGGNGYSYGYCTWHAANRRAEIGRPIPRNLGHAVTWASVASRAGLAVSEQPVSGAVLWHKNTYIANGYGHVAFVEAVNDDGSIYVSDMNYAGWNVITYRTVTPGELDQYLFIH